MPRSHSRSTHAAWQWCAATWACLLVLWASFAQAQPAPFECAPLQGSQARQPVYARVAGEARCEGFYQKNVSQPFLQLVSLTRAPPGEVPADAEGRLSLRAMAAADLRLQIEPLRSNPLYRVDLALARGATAVWSSRPMLQATGLALRDLGFLAVAADQSLAPVSMQASDAGNTAYAVLRPSVAVSKLSWRAYRLAPAAAALPGTWQEVAGMPLLAWQRIALPIALPPDGLALRVDVSARDSEDQPLPLLQFQLLGTKDETR